MTKPSRLSLIRRLGIARHMVACLPGMSHTSHAEVAEEFASLSVNHCAPAVVPESTSDDSEAESFPSSFALATRRAGELDTLGDASGIV